MKTKNALKASGRSFLRADIDVGDCMDTDSKRSADYPHGCIGANLAKRNYVKYLVERYNRYREADVSFGRAAHFHYSELFTNIEASFRASTYFIPEERFAELVDYLHDRIDSTILGRRNRKRGIPNFESFDEYVMHHIMSEKPLYVERRAEGDYAVRKPNSARASAIEPTQAKAIARARELSSGKAPHVERVRNTSAGGRDRWRKA